MFCSFHRFELFLSPIPAFTLSTSIKLDKVIASLDHDRHHDDRDDDILLIKLMMMMMMMEIPRYAFGKIDRRPASLVLDPNSNVNFALDPFSIWHLL